MDDLSGRIIKSYQVTGRINSGGFGAVYQAFQPVIEREVALKVILPQFANESQFIQRFEVEAQTVAQLEHPYIVPLYDYWRDPEGAYLVMRLMRGGSLRQVVNQGRAPLELTIEYIDQIAAALGLAHRHNIIHRDIKPENILRDEEGNAFLTDFGIAQRNDIDIDTGDINGLAGSVNYIAPEIIRSQRPEASSDIYSLGIMIYELLSGHLPFTGNVAPTILHAHLTEDFPDIREHVPSLPGEIDHVLQRACAKDPTDRYQTARDFARAFRDAAYGTRSGEIRVTNEMFKIVDNPYKGLRPFNEADAINFFGREELTQLLVDRLNEDHQFANFLAVVGPSGSGKSSVVRAGLIPRLRVGDIGDTFNWYVADMLPGDDPLGNLANTLLGLAPSPLPNLMHRLMNDEDAILWAADQILGDDDDAHLILFIDQFEEVFTLTDDDALRKQLLKMLSHTIKQSGRIYVVVTIRADFFDKPLLYDGIGDLMQSRTQVVLPLTAQEIERAITGPAENANLLVDRELIAAIVADVRREPGALPLLQYTLTELFERRNTNRLTLNLYTDSGGVLSSLARRAQDVYDDLLIDQRHLTQQIFLRLVTLGEGTEDTRRRTRRSELLNVGDDRQAVIDVLDIFGKYRLLTFDRDATTREPTVEIAHEALIKRWDDLKTWLDESRNDVRLQRSLAIAAQEWRDNERQVGYLLHGGRLLQYEEWVDDTTVAINEQERIYLDASIAEKERRAAEERERRQRERELEQRALNRTRFLAVVMAIAVLITVGLTVVAIDQQRNAQQESTNARNARATSDANAINAEQRAREIQNFNLVGIAQAAIDNGDTGFATALLQTVGQNPDLSPNIQSAIYTAAYDTQLRARLGEHTDKVTAIAVSPDGNYIATGSEDLRILLWDANTLDLLDEFNGHRGIISGLAFSPDSTRLVSTGNDAIAIVWNINTSTNQIVLRGHNNVITNVDFAPNGQFIATSSNDDTAIIWRISDGDIIHRLEGHTDSVRDISYSPDGTRVVTASRDSSLIIWDTNSGTIVSRLIGHADSVQSVDYASSGNRIVSGSFDRSVIIWDADSSTVISRLIGHTNEVTSVAFSPDAQYIISTSCAERDNERSCIRGEVLLWDSLIGNQLLEFVGHTEIVNTASFTADGTRIISGSCSTRRESMCIAGEALIWDVDNTNDRIQQLLGHESSVFSVAYDDDNQRLLSGGGSLLLDDQPQGDTRIILWDTATGRIRDRFDNHTGNVNELIFHPDGTHFVSASRDTTVRIWSLLGNEEIRRFEEHTSSVRDIELTSDGQQVLSAGTDRVYLWDFESLTVTLTLENFGSQISAQSLAISPDDRIIATGLNNGIILLWDAQTGEEISRLTGHTDDVLSLDFTTDGRFLISGSADRTVRRWHVSDAILLQTYTGHAASVTDVSVSDDGRYLVSSSEDSTMRYWDVESVATIRTFTGHNGAIFDASFSEDSTVAYTASADGTLIGWRVAVEAVIEWLDENRYQRELSTEELNAYQLSLDPQD